MNITRYFQSCLLMENSGSRILIDPSGAEKDNPQKFGKLDAVLYTHEHSDHFDAGLVKTLMGQGIPVYANAGTAKLIAGQVNVVKDGQQFSVGSYQIKVIELPHCLMWDGGPGPQNSGYLINGKLFDPGDGKELTGLQVDNLVWPITGPDISMKDAFDFAKQLNIKQAIPVHYDGMGAKPELFVRFGEIMNIPYKIHILANGQSIES